MHWELKIYYHNYVYNYMSNLAMKKIQIYNPNSLVWEIHPNYLIHLILDYLYKIIFMILYSMFDMNPH